MTPTKFIPHYLPEGESYLLEVSGIEKPECHDIEVSFSSMTCPACISYYAHIAQLKKYPAPFLTIEHTSELELGKDFEVKENYRDPESGKFHYIIAAPIPVADRVKGSEETKPYQYRVNDWMQVCFGTEISGDVVERNHRFFEEATELVQATGMSKSECLQLVDYVFGRDIGEINQEIGGTMVTLAALCNAIGLDMNKASETELARIWTKVEKIRAKQAAKPKHSPLPIPSPSAKDSEATERILCAAIWYKEQTTSKILPTNIDKGVVLCGHRHGHCIASFVAITGKRSVLPECGEYVQGFITVANKFVDRQEAYKIAFAANQIIGPNKGYSENSIGLTSEDLY